MFYLEEAFIHKLLLGDQGPCSGFASEIRLEVWIANEQASKEISYKKTTSEKNLKRKGSQI